MGPMFRALFKNSQKEGNILTQGDIFRSQKIREVNNPGSPMGIN